jgi:tetratricopeptide (TPR) repeat protein
VLVELKRFTDARNAFVRAIEGDAEHAGAHYNLSFTLSNLGDYDGALRATKRALEIDPYYVSQKFALTIDLQFEKGTIGVAPEISADVLAETLGETFSFDQRLLDNIFQELAPPAAAARDTPKVEDPLALARDYLSKGLMENAASEAARAVQRGADRGDAAVLLGDIFARRGLHGEALERYREARALNEARPDALLGEVRSLLSLDHLDEAGSLAEQLLGLAPDDVEALVAAAKCRAAAGDAGGALTALQQAQTRAPARPDLRKLQGDVALKVGDPTGALTAYRSALELDPGYVQVWLELGRLHELKQEWGPAEQAYEQALEKLPSFYEAALALADLLRRVGRVRHAVTRLATMLEQDPYDLKALLLLGRALLDDKRDTAALEAFRRALKFDPEQVEALFQLGVALARVHRYGDAVEAWERVTRLDPSGPFAQRARIHARTAADLQHIFDSDAA